MTRRTGRGPNNNLKPRRMSPQERWMDLILERSMYERGLAKAGSSIDPEVRARVEQAIEEIDAELATLEKPKEAAL